ncbi:MAG: hypothetical protein ACETWK_10610 [Candidatus Aminicenantaceae bacterium]
MMKIKIVIERWGYGLKARSLCPSEPKRLDSGFALPRGVRLCHYGEHWNIFYALGIFS